jgi:GNAT superfamily N-acetyltransferase
MSVRVALLADHPEVLKELAAAVQQEWPQWYGEYGDAAADLSERSRSSGLPLGLVAIENGRAVGTLAIAERATPSHPQLTPWIVGFWVETARRKRGIGARLLKAACAWAWTAEFEYLYAATPTASPLFLREGWHKIDIGTTEGGAKVDIFAMKLS